MFKARWRTVLVVSAIGVAALWRLSAGGSAAARHAPLDTADDLILATFFSEMLPGLRAAADDYYTSTGVRVRVQGVPYNAYEMWLRTQFLSRRPPEIVLIESTALPWFYGQAGLLVELSEAVRRPNPFDEAERSWAAAFREPYLQLCRDATGQLWCLPFTQFGVGFFYDRDTYAALSLEPPRNWSELVANFRRVHAAGRTALVTAIGPSDAQTVWIASMLEEWLMRKYVPAVNVFHATGWVFDPDDPANTLDERIDLDERIIAFERGLTDPARAPEYAELLRLIHEASQYWRLEFAGIDVRELEALFANRKSVHFMNGTWYLPVLRNHMALLREVAPENVFDWGTFPFPELTPADTRVPTVGGVNQNAGMRACLVVPRQPQDPARESRALTFCQYLTSPRGMRKVMGSGRVYDIPALKDVPPHDVARPLLAEQSYALLPVSAIVGYDAQATSEFWTVWQRWFSGELDDRPCLEQLSAIHRRSLRRLFHRFEDQVDVERIRSALKGNWPTWLPPR